MKFIFPESEPIQARPWRGKNLPNKILFIRFHAFGDTLVSLPAAEALKDSFPEVELHLLICKAYSELPLNMPVFKKVYTLKHAQGGWPMALDLLAVYPALLREGYDAVVDLQNNIHSRTARLALFPAAWTQFDRYSKIHVLQRYQNTVNALGLAQIEVSPKITLRDEQTGLEKLTEKGWNGSDQLILLNPCGGFPTRQWGEEKYLTFARIWRSHVDENTKFVLLGYSTLFEKTHFLSKELGASCINLIGQTSIKEVFNIVRRVNLSISDDGGLLHASWVNQVPTIGFLGASPSYWGRPLGKKSYVFTSDDLQCGNCHSIICIWGDNRCLARITPEMVVEHARILLGV